MDFRIGDSIFNATGNAGVLKDKRADTGDYVVNADPKEVRKDMRHGYINGLSEQQRTGFNAVMDEVRQVKEPEKRVEMLQGKLDELSKDPGQFILTRYLRAEMAHIMHSFNIQQKVYTIDESRTG